MTTKAKKANRFAKLKWKKSYRNPFALWEKDAEVAPGITMNVQYDKEFGYSLLIVIDPKLTVEGTIGYEWADNVTAKLKTWKQIDAFLKRNGEKALAEIKWK